jgi:plastocyanin
MRKLEAACAAAAAVGLGLIGATVAQSALVNISVEDNEFVPAVATFEFAANPDVSWDWNFPDGTANDHNVVSKRGLFRSGNPKTNGDFDLAASAGKYAYYCENHRSDGMKGKVNILPNANDVAVDAIEVEWAIPENTTGKRFDVRYKIDDGKFKYWKRNTKKMSGLFGGPNAKPVEVNLDEHDYSFQARSRKGPPSKHKISGFSPPLVVTEADA